MPLRRVYLALFLSTLVLTWVGLRSTLGTDVDPWYSPLLWPSIVGELTLRAVRPAASVSADLLAASICEALIVTALVAGSVSMARRRTPWRSRHP